VSFLFTSDCRCLGCPRRYPPGGDRSRHRRPSQRQHTLASAQCRRHSSLATSKLDSSPGSRLRPDFAHKAGRFLDLYAHIWQGKPLHRSEFVISADEKTSVQARCRKQPSLPTAAGRPMRVEHEYFREGAWTYLAAWDVHRAKFFGHCEKENGIAPTARLIAEVMAARALQIR
jgi:hypothetical protein